MLKHVWGNLANDEVVHPVGRGTKCDTIRTVGHGPDLRNDNPCTWAPGIAEEDDEEPHHDASSPASALMAWPVVLVTGYDTGDDEVAGRHTDGAADENGLSAEFVNVHDCGDCGLLIHALDVEMFWVNLLVARNMTIPTTPVASRLMELPDKPNPWKIVGA